MATTGRRSGRAASSARTLTQPACWPSSVRRPMASRLGPSRPGGAGVRRLRARARRERARRGRARAPGRRGRRRRRRRSPLRGGSAVAGVRRRRRRAAGGSHACATSSPRATAAAGRALGPLPSPRPRSRPTAPAGGAARRRRSALRGHRGRARRRGSAAAGCPSCASSRAGGALPPAARRRARAPPRRPRPAVAAPKPPPAAARRSPLAREAARRAGAPPLGGVVELGLGRRALFQRHVWGPAAMADRRCRAAEDGHGSAHVAGPRDGVLSVVVRRGAVEARTKRSKRSSSSLAFAGRGARAPPRRCPPHKRLARARDGLGSQAVAKSPLC